MSLLYESASNLPPSRQYYSLSRYNNPIFGEMIYVWANGVVSITNPETPVSITVSRLEETNGTEYKVYYFAADHSTDGHNNLTGGTGLDATNYVCARRALVVQTLDVIP